MTKRIYILLFVLVFSHTAFSQFVGRDHLSVALFYMQKAELDSAKKYIDLAGEDESLRTEAKTWYYKGFVYKDLYKSQEKADKNSPYRLEAIKAFEVMKPLDVENEFAESTSKILKYLASTLYNDAVRSLSPETYTQAISHYELYKKTMKAALPSTEFNSQDVKFKMALASMLNKPAESASGLDSVQVIYIKKLYTEILEIDENNPGANYNLATLYYNEAADIINSMDYDMDIVQLNKIQDYCIEIFLKGLPYMKKSYDLNYKRKETLIGLSNIYYGLNDIEKSEQYKKELEELEKE
ncbi:MAG: hypothetical protein P1U41_03405 [Vicingaceae bacterium]|nr:hypothetical protein [Vicingaceae bacterium]